jgi:hypothetical protein
MSSKPYEDLDLSTPSFTQELDWMREKIGTKGIRSVAETWFGWRGWKG